jgi:hypothetical protein
MPALALQAFRPSPAVKKQGLARAKAFKFFNADEKMQDSAGRCTSFIFSDRAISYRR